MLISTLAHVEAPPNTVETTWEDLSAALIIHKETKTKGGTPLWTPAVFAGKVRKGYAVQAVSAYVIDFDECSEAQVRETLSRIQQAGITGAWHTSWRFEQGLSSGFFKSRVVFPFEQPVTRAAWPSVWRELFKWLAPWADRKCKDPNRSYFLPSCLPSAKRYAYRWGGTPLRIEDAVKGNLMAPAAKANVAAQDPWAAANREALQPLLRKWRGRPLHEALRSLLDGAALAAPGHRDNITFMLTRDLLREFPWFTDESLADLFRPSIHAQGGEPTLDKLLDQIRRGREAITEERNAPVTLIDGNNAISPPREAYASSEVPPQTPFIIQTDDSAHLYIYSEGAYVGPVMPAQAQARLVTLLHPAVNSNLVSLTDSAGKPKPVWRLVAEYGKAVSHVEYEIGRTTPAIEPSDDGETEVLVLGTAARQLEPRWSAMCDRWLRALSGGSTAIFQDLCVWLMAAKYRPREPLAALVLTGNAGVGKSLFAVACARMWSEAKGPTSAQEVFDSFQASLKTMPLVFADEELPSDLRGRNRSAQLRRLITAREIDVNRKFVHQIRVRGAYRWLVAANSKETISFSDELTDADLDAVLERFYSLHVGPDLATMLRNKTLDPDVIVSELAGHVCYLYNSIQAPYTLDSYRQGRLWIVQREALHPLRDTVSVAGPFRERLLQWIVLAILNLGRLRAHKPDAMTGPLDDGEHIRVSTRDVVSAWDLFCDGHAITPHRATKALAMFSGDRTRRLGARGEQTQCGIIAIKTICDMAEHLGLATSTEIRTAVAKYLAERSRFYVQPGDPARLN